MNNKIERRLDISSKLIEMGQSLMNEGKDNKDFAIAQTGSFMILIGSLLFEEKDVLSFGELCSMYSAKKILENLEKSIPNLSSLIKEKAEDESYDDLIKKINKLRGDLGKETEE
jgi:hypothetical protein